MRFYIESADISVWHDLMSTDLFYGITTNPTLAYRSGLSYTTIDWGEMARQAADLGAKELHAQVYGPVEGYTDWAGAFYEQGNAAGLRPVVKVPLTEDAVRKIGALKELGGALLLTAAYDAKQMLIATLLSVDYIAPYFGRMIDNGIPALDVLSDMLAIRNKTKETAPHILVASLRTTDQLVRLAAQGHDHFTIAPNISRALLNDKRTLLAVEEFEDAATKLMN